MKTLDRCPEWPLIRCYSRRGTGGWSAFINAEAETFARPDDAESTPVHLHLYARSIEDAREIYRSVRHRLPNTIESVSWS